MPTSQSNSFLLGAPPWVQNQSTATAFSNASGMVIDATTEMIGFKYLPATTSPIVAVDIRLTLVGTSPTFICSLWPDTADTPDTGGTQLGTDTPGWTLAATGWTGLKVFGTDSGNLTVNTPVWIVIEYSSGTCDGSNNIQAQARGVGTLFDRIRHYNGTNWTTTAAIQTAIPFIVIKHADGTFAGIPLTAVAARSSQNDIYVNGGTTQVQGIRFKCGAQIKVLGVAYWITKTGSPDALTWTAYEGDTSKYSESIAAASVISFASGIFNIAWFGSPILLAADTNLYLIASQTGTSDSNDYDLTTAVFDTTYIDAILPADFRFVYGNGTTPSGLTVSSTEFPFVFPVVANMATDFDQAASGGGGSLLESLVAA